MASRPGCARSSPSQNLPFPHAPRFQKDQHAPIVPPLPFLIFMNFNVFLLDYKTLHNFNSSYILLDQYLNTGLSASRFQGYLGSKGPTAASSCEAEEQRQTYSLQLIKVHPGFCRAAVWPKYLTQRLLLFLCRMHIVKSYKPVCLVSSRVSLVFGGCTW